jgi:hypothetical protein
MTTTNDVLKELKPYQLTRVIGHQPTHQDIEKFMKSAKMLTLTLLNIALGQNC